MNEIMTSAVLLIRQNVEDRREKGKAFLTPCERELLDELACHAEEAMYSLPYGLQGLGELMVTVGGDVVPEATHRIGMLVSETTQMISAAAEVRESVNLLQKTPVLEKAPWEEAKDAWLGAFIKHSSEKKRNKVMSELSREHKDDYIKHQLLKLPAEEVKSLIEKAKAKAKEKAEA